MTFLFLIMDDFKDIGHDFIYGFAVVGKLYE